MRILSILTAIVLAPFWLAMTANAAGDDVFVVARVPVEATADTATAAKSQAQGQGRRRALDLLLRRLVPEEDWVYLPTLAAGYPAQAEGDGMMKRSVDITPAMVEALEAGFEIYGEKSSSRLYKAAITYRFKPDAVRRLLKDAGLAYSEAQTRTALVLPVLQTDSSVYLWEPNNPWMAAWKSRPYTHELTPMVAPLGDLEDTSKITARQALALDQDGLEALARHYGISQIIVAHARLKQNNGEDQVSVRLVNAYRESEAAAASSVLGEVDIAEVQAGAESGGLSYGVTSDEDFAAKVGDVLAQVYMTQPSGNFPMLAEKLIESSIAKYAAGWKAKTLIDHAAEQVLPASAFFESLGDWSRIRSALIAAPLVASVQISALSKGGAEMDLRVLGEPRRLQVALQNQGVVLWNEGGNRWFLAMPSVAAKYRGQRFLRERRGLFGEENTLPSDLYGPVPTSLPTNEGSGAPAKIEN